MKTINANNEIELTATENDLRINKFLAQNDVCSRREADTMIDNGQVKVNLISKKNNIYGIAEPGMKLSIGDKVKVKVETSNLKYFVLNRVSPPPKSNPFRFSHFWSSIPHCIQSPREGLTASKTPLGELSDRTEGVLKEYNCKAILDLDKDSDGLVLYSNDTLLKKKIASSTHLLYEYIVKVKEPAEAGILAKLKYDIMYEGQKYKGAKSVRTVGGAIGNAFNKSSGATINIVLREYQSHIIKRLMNAVHMNVLATKRVRIGNLHASDFKVDTLIPLTAEQIEEFKKCL